MEASRQQTENIVNPTTENLEVHYRPLLHIEMNLGRISLKRLAVRSLVIGTALLAPAIPISYIVGENVGGQIQQGGNSAADAIDESRAAQNLGSVNNEFGSQKTREAIKELASFYEAGLTGPTIYAFLHDNKIIKPIKPNNPKGSSQEASPATTTTSTTKPH